MRLSVGKIGGQVEIAGNNILAAFSRVPLFWEWLGSVIIAILLARWTWILIAPGTISVIPPKSDENMKLSGLLFGISATSGVSSSNAVAALGNIHLVGVFTGSKGFAVFKTDEKSQHGVAVGEEVVNGSKLIEVGADYVVLLHNGLNQQIKLENKSNSKDTAMMAQSVSTSGVQQAVTGWNQANQEIQQKRQMKTPNVHRQ